MQQIHFAVLLIALCLTPSVRSRVQIEGDTVVETGTHYFGNNLNTTAASSAVDCSQQCRTTYNNSCNIFTFCGTESGCLDGAAGTSPVGTCNLKVQDVVWPVNAQQPIVTNIDRNDGRIPWASGAPMWFNAPVALPGWEVFRGVDLFGYYDYACYGPDRSPNVNQCQYHGTAQEIADHCDRDPECQAFSYITNSSTLPTTSPYSPVGRWSVGVLKNDFDMDLAFSAGNPSAVIYWKPGLHAAAPTQSPGFYAGIAIAAVVVAIAVLASGWLLVRRRLGKRPRISRPILPAIAKPGAAKRQPAQRLPSDAVILSQESHDLLISPLQMPSSTLHGSTSGDPVLLHGATAAGQISPEQISICQQPNGKEWLAGEGSCGQVFKALLDGVTVVAVKRLHGYLDARQSQAFLREIATLRNLHSPHIVQFLGACLEPGNTMLVTEWMEESLWAAIAQTTSQGLPTVSLGWYGRGRSIALDVAKGLHHLHSRNIIHLDLKSSNILLHQGAAKIADVGFAKILSQSVHSQQMAGGTWAWAAPEVLLGRRSTTQADIYSFGVLMWEIITGESPVRGRARDVLVPQECPVDIRELLHECFDTDPRRRPTARSIVHRLDASGQKRPLPQP